MNKLTINTVSTGLLTTLASLTGSLLLDNGDIEKQNVISVNMSQYYSNLLENTNHSGFSTSGLNISIDDSDIKFEAIKTVSEKILKESLDLDKEIVDIVDEKFWDLM